MSTVPFTFAGNTGNIPLSQLDQNFANVKLSVDYVIQNTQSNITAVGTLTSLSVSGNIVHSGNLVITGAIVDSGQLDLKTTAGNSNISLQPDGTGIVAVSTQISAVGNVTGANLITAGIVTATGNILSSGNISVAGNITGNNLSLSGLITATGNITSGNITTTDMNVNGNLVVAGNAQVNGTTTFINTTNLNITDKNITIANGVSTSALIDGAGIDAGNPVVAYIRYSNASQGWTTANSFTIGTTLSVTGNATLSGNTALSGVSTAPTPANTVANTQIATTAFVRNIVPTGVITLWYGSLAAIPNGWFLCDGSNGTPDLRDRFIVGAGSTYAVNATGGSANAVLVDHTHTASSVVTDPGHNHSYTAPAGAPNNAAGAIPDQITQQTLNTANAFTGITVATTIANAGVSGTNANLPPYYALAYIMKA